MTEEATPLERPSKIDRSSVPYEPIHRPWLEPPEITPELEALADAWDEGGRDLICEVED